MRKNMMTVLVTTGAVSLLPIGCGDSKEECSPGTENCECVAGDACNAGLSCQNGICVGSDAGGTDPGSTDTGTGTGTPPDTNPTQSQMILNNMGNGVVCAEGVVVGPADDDGWGDHWGAGIGFNICQASSGADKTSVGDCNIDLSRFIGVRVKFSGQMPPELRINMEDDVDGDNPYLVADSNNLDTPQEFLFDDAVVGYFPEEDQVPFDRSHLLSVQFQVASLMGSIDEFNFCVDSVEIILGEETGGGDAGVGDAGDAADAGTSAIPQPTDTAVVCTPDSLMITPNEHNWIHACTNVLGIQGDYYRYADGD